MPTINQLSTSTTLSSGDKLIVYSSENADARKASLTTLLDFLYENFQEPGLTTQVVVPTTGQNIPLTAQSQNLWLVLNPASSLASLTVTLPPAATAVDGQEVSISTSQGITTFSVSGNTATVAGSPTALAAGAFFTLKYSETVGSNGTWYATLPTIPATWGDIVVTGAINDGNNNEVIKIGSTPSAVNEITVTNATSSSGPLIAATGTSTNIELSLAGKGTGAVEVRDPTGGLYYPVVTTGGTQTLSGKTLTSPTINTPTITTPTITGTSTVGAVVLGGNITVDTNDTRKIGTSSSNRLLELWANTASVVNVACSALTATTSVVAAAASIDNDLTAYGDVKATDLIGYGTATDPPTGTVGALTQRNATLACASYYEGAGLSTKRYNVSLIEKISTYYKVTLNDAVSTDSIIVATLLSQSSISGGSIYVVGHAEWLTTTTFKLYFFKLDFAASPTEHVTATTAVSFSFAVIGSPATDRTI